VCVCVCVCVYNRYFVRKEHCEPKFLTEYWVELNASYVCVCVCVCVCV
jgi:hypothetical protein